MNQAVHHHNRDIVQHDLQLGLEVAGAQATRVKVHEHVVAELLERLPRPRRASAGECTRVWVWARREKCGKTRIAQSVE